jgi:chromosome segregation ATPase
MSNEQEPMPKMQASKDDIAVRQKQLQQRRVAAQRAAKARPASAEQAIAPAPKQTIAIVALLISLAMAGFSGFLFMQLQEANAQLKKAEGVLNGHSTNLSALNDKLSASDENSNLSVGALRILLKDNGKEIRKLWDLSNKSNKPKIAKNGKAIGSVKSSVTKVSKKVTGIDKKIGTANSNINGNKKSIATLKSSLAKNQKNLEAKMAEVKASINALPAETEKRIGNNEQSIRSIDATRKKLNGSMAEVESQFNEMKLEIEDIQIRLDRMQNAMSGTL